MDRELLFDGDVNYRDDHLLIFAKPYKDSFGNPTTVITLMHDARKTGTYKETQFVIKNTDLRKLLVKLVKIEADNT